MRRLVLCAAALIVLVSLSLLTGCEGVFTGTPRDNLPPEVWLSSGPVEGTETGYQVRFYWSGWDPDGAVSFYEFCFVEGRPIGFSPADTTGLDKWSRTAAHDSVFRVTADENPQPYPDDERYTVYKKTHTLFMRAVDLEGMRSEPVYRSFTAQNIAPRVKIDAPPWDAGIPSYSSIITFRWTGTDPIDDPVNTQDPDSIRWLNILRRDTTGIYNPDFDIIKHMNEYPGFYESEWSPWIAYRAPADAGRTVTVRVDEVNKRYIFALQALDEAGAVTALIDRSMNARIYLSSGVKSPLLTVKEPLIGTFNFSGTGMNFQYRDLPPGVPLNFTWEADASSYGGEIRSYRYGWDIDEIDNPNAWEPAPLTVTAAKTRTWYSGVHRLLIEAVDNGRQVTYGKFELTIIPFTRERSLLWVDDWKLGDDPVPNRMLPTEAEHDAFWIDLCSRAPGFNPERDVYDVSDNNNKEPDIRLVSQYANMIWTYKGHTTSAPTAWRKLITFATESQGGSTGAVNYLALFIAGGGRLLTCGMGNDNGGLVAAFFSPPKMPASFKFDMDRYDGADTSGVNSMPYRDYCVSVVDKVSYSAFHSGVGIPARDWRNDAMRILTKEVQDATPGAVERYPVFPDTLRLSALVTCPTCFFNPQVRGFTYVEVYNPQYWMTYKGYRALSCFHPIYRMRTRSTLSPLDHQAVAIVITKFRERFERDIEAGRPVEFTPANSFHFGFPLWFFNHQDVYTIIDAIFADWEILIE